MYFLDTLLKFDYQKMYFLDTLRIQLLKPNLNLDFSSYPLHLFNAWKT